MARFADTLYAFGVLSACQTCPGTELRLEHGRWLSAALRSEAGSETLGITCSRCGYRWLERCADDHAWSCEENP
jgi:hypothetical protein